MEKNAVVFSLACFLWWLLWGLVFGLSGLSSQTIFRIPLWFIMAVPGGYLLVCVFSFFMGKR